MSDLSAMAKRFATTLLTFIYAQSYAAPVLAIESVSASLSKTLHADETAQAGARIQAEESFQDDAFETAQDTFDALKATAMQPPTPAISPSNTIIRDDNFLDPRGDAYVGKWLKAGQFMPLSELKPGMQGYGLTVFQGNKIEKFDVTVIGVVKKVLSGRDAVMVRLSGPLLGKNTVIRGMSGSPVYIEGKLVGAVSYGFDFSREPIVGITPITDMLDALTPDKRSDDGPPGRRIGYRLPNFGSANSDIGMSSNSGITTTSGGGPKLVPLIAPVSLSGFSSNAQEFLGDHLKNFGMAVSAGTAGAIDETLDDDSNATKNYPAETIKPGGAVSVLLVTGDFSASATGTATTTLNGNVLAFGHPFMQAGPVDFPMATAYIHQVLPNLAVSFKVASPVKVVGAVTNDRPWAIGGQLGKQSKMIPATYTVTDRTRGVKKTFHINVISHADLTPELLASTAMSAIDTTHQSTSPYIVSVDSKVLTDKAGTIERHDKFAGNFSVHTPIDASFKLKSSADSVSFNFLSMLNRIVNNDFERASIKGVNLNIVLDDGHETARVERISLDKQKVEPGETVKVSAVLRPYNKPREIRELTLKVPRDIPDGNLLLGVGPGDQIDLLRKRMGVTDPQPENLRQVANRLREQGQSNVLEAVLALPEQSLFLDGRRIVSPPANWLKLFFSDRYTKGPQIVKGEVRAKAGGPWLLDGMHLLALNVERKEKALAQTPVYSISPTNSHAPHDGIFMTEQARKVLDSSPRKSDSTGSSSSTSSSTTSSLASVISSAISSPSASSASSEKRESTSAATSFAASKQYPHMRTALAWRQTTEEDFRNGKTEEAALDSRGRLSPGYRELAKATIAPEMQIWSAAANPANKDAVIFAAQNTIYSWNGSTQTAEKVAKLNCSFVPALVVDSKGMIFAATAPGDRVVSAGGKLAKQETLFRTAGEQVTTLCIDDRDNIYAGVASDGKVWKYDAAGKNAKVIFDSGQAHITSLWFSKTDRRVYVGTGEKGAVYSISDNGISKAEYQTNDHIVTGAVKDSKGNLYITTAGQGRFIRVKPGGEVDNLATSEGFYSIAYDPTSDTVFAGDAEGDITQAKQEEVTNRAYFVPVAHTSEEAVSALVPDGNGHLFAATSNFARCFKYDLTPSTNATYISQIRDAQRPSTWSKLIAYGALSQVEPNLIANLNVDTRTGNSSQPDASWSDWTAAGSTNEGFNISSPRGRYLQYRLKWKAQAAGAKAGKRLPENNTVRKIDVTYLPNNAQPYLTSISVQAGSHLSGKQEITMSGSDPDHDNMLISLDISDDDGKTWKTLTADLRSKKDVSKDTKNKDTKDKDSKDKDSKNGDTKSKDSNDKVSNDKISKGKISNEKGAKEQDLKDSKGSDVVGKNEKSEKPDASDDREEEVKGDLKEKSSVDDGKRSRDLQVRDSEKEPSKDSQNPEKNHDKDQEREQAKDPSKDQAKDPAKEQPKESAKDPSKDASKEVSKDASQTKDSIQAKEKPKSKVPVKEAENPLAKALNALKSATQPDSESQTEQFTYSWDTTKQKDGNYVLRVRIADRLSNPRDYLENERWGTITVDNTAPVISDVKLTSDRDASQKPSTNLELTATDKLSSITNAIYKIDNGSPFAMMRVNSDGSEAAADSQTAKLKAQLLGVKAGEHKFVIEVTDQAGNTESKTVTLTVK